MVIGHGMIARQFGKYSNDENLLVFASGVSNSSSSNEADYNREQDLLLQTLQQQPGKKIIYFSTCSIYDPSLQESMYVRHKLRMENLIREEAASYIIFRVSNPVGYTPNPYTVLNYFVQHIKSQDHFTLWQYAGRNLIDIEDVFKICDALLQSQTINNAIVNIANPVNYPVISIIEAIEQHFSKKGNYTLAKKGSSPLIDTTAIQPLFSLLEINFDNNYLPALLKKYFPIHDL
jgi:nucleoside-diphosphate-sugar epimerase